jgi:hypothetical protein
MRKIEKVQESTSARLIRENSFDHTLPKPIGNGNNKPIINKPIIPRGLKKKLPLRNLTAIGAQSELNITRKNNLIYFKSSEDYRKLVDNLSYESETEVKALLSSLKHKSFINRNSSNSQTGMFNPYRSTILEYLLNENEAVQIGDHVYKIRSQDGLIDVITPGRSWDYTDLYSLNSNPRIVTHPINLDIISLVEGDNLWCSASYAPPAQMTSPVWNVGVSQHQSLAKYTTLGIYFKLYGEISNISRSSFEFIFNDGLGYIHWQERCGSMADYGTRTPGTHISNSLQYKTYEGSKGLTNYFFQFYTWSNQKNDFGYGWLCIRHNW